MRVVGNGEYQKASELNVVDVDDTSLDQRLWGWMMGANLALWRFLTRRMGQDPPGSLVVIDRDA